ncbi:MAG: bacterial extracellular solute-binding protein family 5 middle, partial [Akkermansiaceae bacterium]|nr:bacterial extracellular solute-binding protein family 5 middle [Akkermansiaceae bacterium]
MTRCALALIPVLLGLVGCQKETDVAKANREKILLVGNSTDPKSLDPHLVTGVIESNIIRSMFEGLVADDPKEDLGYPPGAATSWEHNEDYTEWTFHLREGGKWSDGAPLTAGDFVFSYNRILSPELAGPYAEMLFFLKNAEAYNKGEIKDFNEVGVKAVDDYTLKLELREPVPFLLGLTRHYTWFPMPRHVILKFGKMGDRFTPWSEPGNLVGNGPFRLKDWRINDHVEVERNPNYWAAGEVKLNGIRFIPIENFYSEPRAFLSGQLHVTYQLPPPLVDKTKAMYPQFVRQEPYFSADLIRYNTNRKGFDDPRVRLAMAWAIDRETICKKLLQGSRPAPSLTPPLGQYQPDPVIGFDKEKAQKYLADAGYPGGAGFPNYSLLAATTGTRAVIEALQAMWYENLGIKIEIRQMDFASYVTAQQNLDYDLSLGGWSGDYLDPSTFLLMWTKDNGNNNT